MIRIRKYKTGQWSQFQNVTNQAPTAGVTFLPRLEIRALLFVLLVISESYILSSPIFHNVPYLNIYEFILALSRIFYMINLISHPLSQQCWPYHHQVKPAVIHFSAHLWTHSCPSLRERWKILLSFLSEATRWESAQTVVFSAEGGAAARVLPTVRSCEIN